MPADFDSAQTQGHKLVLAPVCVRVCVCGHKFVIASGRRACGGKSIFAQSADLAASRQAKQIGANLFGLDNSWRASRTNLCVCFAGRAAKLNRCVRPESAARPCKPGSRASKLEGRAGLRAQLAARASGCAKIWPMAIHMEQLAHGARLIRADDTRFAAPTPQPQAAGPRARRRPINLAVEFKRRQLIISDYWTNGGAKWLEPLLESATPAAESQKRPARSGAAPDKHLGPTGA